MLALQTLQGMQASVLNMPATHYAGFVPNNVFFNFSPACVLTYAVAQHLSFHGRSVTPAAIAKIAPRHSERTINNSLTKLTKEGVLKKESYGQYLFFNEKSGIMLPSNNLTNNNLGYYIKIHYLKDGRLSNKEILGLVIIENLTYQKKRTLSIDFIAKVMQSSRSTSTRIINALEDKGYLSRARANERSPYIYRVEKPKGDRMSLSTNTDLSTGKNLKTPQNDALKTPQNDIQINGDFLNIHNKDMWLNGENEATYEIQKNESLKNLEAVISSLTSETEALDRSKRKTEGDIKRLNDDYTAACKARDLEKMASVRSFLAKAEIALREAEEGILHKQLNMQDWQTAIKADRGLPVQQEDINRIGTAVKKILPDFSNSMAKKMAFCLLFNSIIKDLRIHYYEKLKDYRYVKDKERLAMVNAISVCLYKLAQPSYRLNRAIYNDKTAPVVEIAPKPSNERYGWLEK